MAAFQGRIQFNVILFFYAIKLIFSSPLLVVCWRRKWNMNRLASTTNSCVSSFHMKGRRRRRGEREGDATCSNTSKPAIHLFQRGHNTKLGPAGVLQFDIYSYPPYLRCLSESSWNFISPSSIETRNNIIEDGITERERSIGDRWIIDRHSSLSNIIRKRSSSDC